MKTKLSIVLLLSIAFTNTISASTGAEQAKMLVMAVGGVVIIFIINLLKKKKP